LYKISTTFVPDVDNSITLAGKFSLVTPSMY
jgi:hypothetical protein